MKRTALILLTTVAGLASLCAGLLTYGYISFRDMPERVYRSQGPNAAWADHKWVAAIQPLESYASFATALRRNRVTDVYFDMGWPEADGSVPAGRYTAAPYLLREMRAQQPTLRLHAWIGQVERRGGGTLDLADAEVRRGLTATAARFLALGFDGIHFSFPGAGSGNAHLLMLLDQVHNLTRRLGSTLSLSTDALEPVPGLAWLTRKSGSRHGFWTRRYYKAVAARVDQIAVVPSLAALPVPWLKSGLVAWQTKSIRRLTAGRAVLFMGVPAHEDAAAKPPMNASLDGSALTGIRKGMGALSDDSFNDFGLALEARWMTAGQGDHALLENWLDSGDIVVR
jgi:hypothetical protein